MFVGKLDAWEQPNSAVPADLSCLALPLVRLTGFATWNAIVERTAPLSVRPARHADDLAMLRYRA